MDRVQCVRRCRTIESYQKRTNGREKNISKPKDMSNTHSLAGFDQFAEPEILWGFKMKF